MQHRHLKPLWTLVVIVLCSALLAACGRAGATDWDGEVAIDGSSTVLPISQAVAEEFIRAHGSARISIGQSGTGGGFEKFCRGDIDISDASREIRDEEAATCAEHDIQPIELSVANDGLSIVVNPDNDWVDCLTVEQLKAIWGPDSNVSSWQDVDPRFPDEPVRLFGPGTDSGTFDYFTDVIVGDEGASRSDYSATEDDNVTVQGVGGEKGGLGYFGLSYYEENAGTLKALEIDGGDGCVAPTVENAQNGTYKPLARPLFVYVENGSIGRPEVKAFLEYMIDEAQSIAETAGFVPLTPEQQEQARKALTTAEAAG